MCKNLRGVIANIIYPEPFIDPSGYIQSLNDAITRLGVEVILPVHEDIFIASAYASEIAGSGVCLLAPPLPELLALHDKWEVFLTARSLGIATPDTYLANDSADLLRHIDIGLFPMVLKPRFGEGARGVVYCHSEADFHRQLNAISRRLKSEPYVVQRYVKGRGVGVGILSDKGSILARCGHLRIREVPLSGGASTCRQTISEPSILDAAATFMSSKRYSGIAMLEFKLDPVSGDFFLIDINPRYWGGLSTHILSGVDFPALHVAALAGSQPPCQLVEATHQVETRWFFGEILAGLELLYRCRATEAFRLFSSLNASNRFEDFERLGFRSLSVQLLSYLLRLKNRKSRAESRKAFFGNVQ